MYNNTAKITYFIILLRIRVTFPSFYMQCRTSFPEGIFEMIFAYWNFSLSLRPERRCGEIWLLATTLKNAKMLTRGSSCHDDRFHINVLCFCDGSASCGAYFFEITDIHLRYELSFYIRIGVGRTPRQGIGPDFRRHP